MVVVIVFASSIVMADTNSYDNYGEITFDADNDGFYDIRSVDNLQSIANDLENKYELVQDIDTTKTQNWNDNGTGGYYEFSPIGSSSSGYGFARTFDGEPFWRYYF